MPKMVKDYKVKMVTPLADECTDQHIRMGFSHTHGKIIFLSLNDAAKVANSYLSYVSSSIEFPEEESQSMSTKFEQSSESP